MPKLTTEFTIGMLAKAAGVNIETIRFYQRRGLLLQPARPPGGIRRYREADAARVRFIKAAQRLGFSLDEIGLLLKLDDGAHCGEAREIAELKLAGVRARLADLKQIETVLTKLIGKCRSQRGSVSCPLIESLQD